MRYPYSGLFTLVSAYGNRNDPFTGEIAWHGGIDLVGNVSKQIHALSGGTVLRSRMVTDKSNRTWEWGNYVSVLGDDGMTVYYCHLAERTAQAGQRIEEGDIIGTEGSSGKSTGSHLHLEVRNSSGSTLSAAEYIGVPNEPGIYGDYNTHLKIPDGAHDWSAESVNWAMETGIILGDSGDLKLGSPCTREQMCVFLHRMYKLIKGEGEA